jgi:transcriptional regulator with XRE-family HTH domain
MSLTTPTKTQPDVINILRKSIGMTDDELASRSGLARSTLRTKYHNVELFTLSELKRIASVLGVSYLDLISE